MRPVLGIVAALTLTVSVAVEGQMTQDQALALAFPDAEIERRTAFLDDGQLDAARSLAGSGVEVDAGLVTYYLARQDGTPVGVAYFDAHRVRTLQEVLMIVVTPASRVARVETVSFREPPEYQAPDGWTRQMVGRALDDDLSLRAGIANITGATLTANAVTDATRRVLALHAVIAPFDAGGP